ncbi:MAG: hypothetical protein GQ524_01985 [Anaerolineales bacterium]|nr:hypothetical protein [Anaerolineales bacterium]
MADAKEGMMEAMRSARNETRGAVMGRRSNRKIEIYQNMTPEMLNKIAEKYGVDATIDYVMAMEKEAGSDA